jgi:hypothetical protein
VIDQFDRPARLPEPSRNLTENAIDQGADVGRGL